MMNRLKKLIPGLFLLIFSMSTYAQDTNSVKIGPMPVELMPDTVQAMPARTKAKKDSAVTVPVRTKVKKDSTTHSTKVLHIKAFPDTVKMIKPDSISKNILSGKEIFLSGNYPVTTFDYSKIDTTISESQSHRIPSLRKTKENWIVFLLVGIFVFITLIRNVYSRNFAIIFQAYWNDRVIGQFTREEGLSSLRTAFILFVLFCFIFALLLYNIAGYFSWNLPREGLDAYWILWAAVFLFYSIKYILMKLSAYIFSFPRLMSGYLAIQSISNIVYVMMIFPILIFYQFMDSGLSGYLLYAMLFFLVFNAFYKYLRSGSFAVKNFQFPKFYLFVYFCSLEILPLLVVVKLIRDL